MFWVFFFLNILLIYLFSQRATKIALEWIIKSMKYFIFFDWRFLKIKFNVFVTFNLVVIKICYLLSFQFLMNMRLSMHLLVGFLIGGLYYNIGDEASNVMDNFGLIFYSVVFLMFTSLLSMIVTCELS